MEFADVGFLRVDYITCEFCDCKNNCFDYGINLKNKQIKFALPHVDSIQPRASFYRMSAPEVEKSILLSKSAYMLWCIKKRMIEQ